MRGIQLYNFPAFDVARDLLRANGWDVISPADMDRAADGFNPAELPAEHDWNQFPEGVAFSDCVRRDLEAVIYCDAIYLLPGWERSKGARAEYAVAVWLGKEVIEQKGIGNDGARINQEEHGVKSSIFGVPENRDAGVRRISETGVENCLQNAQGRIECSCRPCGTPYGECGFRHA